jgi:hypothetical protein
MARYSDKERGRIVRAAERLVKSRLRLTEATMNGMPSLDISGRKVDSAIADHRLVTTFARIWGTRAPRAAKRQGGGRRG